MELESVTAWCGGCRASVTAPGWESLDDFFREQDYYVLYFDSFADHPEEQGDRVLCSNCRKKAGKPAFVGECPCVGCVNGRRGLEDVSHV